MAKTLKDNMIGTLTYSIFIGDELYESVDADDPEEYLHGAENIIPGLEKALAGLAEGADFDVTVEPDEAYGDYDEDDIDEIPLEDFDYNDNDDEFAVGLDVELMDEDGEVFEATIIEIDDYNVTVDFNHPLAGETLRYVGKVVSIREASETELEQGMPESWFEDEDDES